MKTPLNFKFGSDALVAFLQNKYPLSHRHVPGFAQPLAHELVEQTRRLDFKKATLSGNVTVGMINHSFDEICRFIDWAPVLWNEILRETYRSRRLTLEELISDVATRDGASSREAMLSLFDSWNEFGNADEGPYLSLKRYPHPTFESDPLATAGNVCAAFGLAILDRCLTNLSGSTKERALSDFGVAWHCAAIARWLNHTEMDIHFNSAGESARMARAARARHSKDPKQKTKQAIRELWQRWEASPATYRFSAAFARAMLDKWPEELSSPVVIERWVRKWRQDEEKGRGEDEED